MKSDESGWTVTPGDGTPEGERLELMNEVLRSMPPGAGRVVLWFDEREHVVEASYEAPKAEPPPDLVSIAGSPDSMSSLAAVIVASLKEG